MTLRHRHSPSSAWFAFGVLATALLACSLGQPIAQNTPTPENTATPEATSTARPTQTPAPTDTAAPTATPEIEARLGVPVANGRWQVVLRNADNPGQVTQESDSWTPVTGRQYVTVEGHFRSLRYTDILVRSVEGAIWNGGSQEAANGIGAGKEYCADCYGLAILNDEHGGELGYLFNVRNAWQVDDLEFAYMNLPHIRLIDAEWKPTTRVPAVDEGLAPPEWPEAPVLPEAGRLTYVQWKKSVAALWAVDGDGQNAQPLQADDMAYGWAKYSTDGRHALILTQPEIGWVDLYLASPDGGLTYPLALDAEWADAGFKADGKSLYFSVLPVDGEGMRLYIGNADGTGIAQVFEEARMSPRPSAGGELALVAADEEAHPWLLARGSDDEIRSWNVDYLPTTSIYAVGAANDKPERFTQKAQVTGAYPGRSIWLVASGTTGAAELSLWNREKGTISTLRSGGTGGWGCVSPDDRFVATGMNVYVGDASEQRYELVASDRLGAARRILTDVKLTNGFYGCQFSADGQHLLIRAALDKGQEEEASVTLFILDTDGNLLEQIENVEAARFSPDGTRIAYTVADGDDYTLYVANPDGGASKEIGAGLLIDWTAAP